MIAMAGRPPPRFDPARARQGWRRGPAGPNFTLLLPDGRWLVARQVRERTNPTFWITAFLALVALAVAVGAYPVVRGLGRRLERLKAGVEQFGNDLGARVKVEGRDEVAALAQSFNRSAERIEQLVAAHRMLLANCSHELRTPLARIAVAASLLGEGADAKTRESLKHDVEELDQLIEQILLASRLEALPTLEHREPVDLLALAAEEAARFDLDATGQPVTVSGDRTLLRRLIRNLLENARRYAGNGPIDRLGHRRRPGALSWKSPTMGPACRRPSGSASSSPSIAWPAAARPAAAAGSASPWCSTSPAVTAAMPSAWRQKAAAAASGSTCRLRKMPGERPFGRLPEERPHGFRHSRGDLGLSPGARRLHRARDPAAGARERQYPLLRPSPRACPHRLGQ